jgi:hypothetical protein
VWKLPYLTLTKVSLTSLIFFSFFSLCLWLTPNLENLITEVGPLYFLKSQSVPKDWTYSSLKCQQSLTSKYRACWSPTIPISFKDSIQYKRILLDRARYTWPVNICKHTWPQKSSGKYWSKLREVHFFNLTEHPKFKRWMISKVNRDMGEYIYFGENNYW